MDQKYILKAQNELMETDDLKAEKLQEFKQWISTHEYFKNVRQGKNFPEFSSFKLQLISFIF